MSILQSPVLVIFPKGLIHGLSWKIKIDLSLFLVKIELQTLFNDVLDRRKGFPDSKNVFFTETP